MKKMFMVFALIMIMLAGCSTSGSNGRKGITYSGESKSWRAILVNKMSKDSNEENYTLSIEYKGNLEDLKDVHQLHYNFKYGQMEVNRSETSPDGLPTNQSVLYKDTGTIRKDSINKQTKISLKIEWNDKREEFELN